VSLFKFKPSQAELACALRFFLWSSVYGSVFGEGGDLDAFSMTMLALQEKVRHQQTGW
jgi:hypothetical protein